MSCPDCITGGFLSGEPKGSIQSNGAYFAPSPSGNASGGDVILLTDGFGLPLKNCKILADKLANGLDCDVWVPDYFAGRPLVPLDSFQLPDRAGMRMTALDWIKFIFAAIPNIPALIANRSSVVDVRIEQFIRALDMEKGHKRLGAIGLASTNLIHAAVVCHPGGFSMTEAQAIKVPTAWACAEEDLFFSKSHRLDTEAMFAKRQVTEDLVPYEFADYKGTTHGFASRPNLAVPDVKVAHEEAFEQLMRWFKKTVLLPSFTQLNYVGIFAPETPGHSFNSGCYVHTCYPRFAYHMHNMWKLCAILSGEPRGSISTLNAYYSPNAGTKSSGRAILLLTDAFGLPVKNCKIMADEYAKRLGCDVWVPDIFDSNPLLRPEDLRLPPLPGMKLSKLEWAKFYFFMLFRLHIVYGNRPSAVMERLDHFIGKIKAEKHYTHIGVVGFCFGGSMAIFLGATDLVNSVVICHPGRFILDDVRAIKVPSAWICAEDDHNFVHEKRLQCESVLAERVGKENFTLFEFVDYKGTTHGFASRPDLSYPHIKEAWEKSIDQTINWFMKTLPMED